MVPEVRIATIGTSGIAERFTDALAQTPGARYAAAYSRDLGHARAFGEPRGATRFFDSLDELAACPEVDAVYIASPNGLHASQALKMIAAGKHVLVEKSLASNEREAREVFEAARERGVVALEAMRNLHTPAFDAIEREAARLGTLRLATFRFAKVTSRIARLRAGERLNIFDPELAGGALMDIGVYCVEPAVALFGEPVEVRALGVTAQAPGASAEGPCRLIDLAGEVLLGYPGMVVSLSYGKLSDDCLPSQIEGEDATLVWDQTSCPCNLRVFEHVDKGLVFGTESGEARPVAVDVPRNDMVCEVSRFASAVAGDEGALEACRRFEGVTLASLRVMDEVRRQLGVVFPADLG